jgi:hypothetical protein
MDVFHRSTSVILLPDIHTSLPALLLLRVDTGQGMPRPEFIAWPH